jgi:hypothetical protein
MARIEHPGHTSLLDGHRADRPGRVRRLGPARGGDGRGDLRAGAPGASAPGAITGRDRRPVPGGGRTAPFVRKQRHRAGHRGGRPTALDGRPGPRWSCHRSAANLHGGSPEAPGAAGAGAPGTCRGGHERGGAPRSPRSKSRGGRPAPDSAAATGPRLRRHRPGTPAVRSDPDRGRVAQGCAPSGQAPPAVRAAHGPGAPKGGPWTPPWRGYPPRIAPPAPLPQPPVPLIQPDSNRPRTA